MEDEPAARQGGEGGGEAAEAVGLFTNQGRMRARL